jgi:soluble lytic murein transglycosylase-like protein
MHRLFRVAPAALVLALAGCDFAGPNLPDIPASTGIVILNPGTGPVTTAGQAPVSSSGSTAGLSGEAALRPLAERHAAQQGVPSGLVLAVISQESGFNPRAVSPVGAQGLMQLMPGTVQHINSAGAVQVLDPFDADQNMAGGTWYLKWVKSQVPTDQVVAGEEWKMALGGYNGGIGRVKSAITKALSGAPINPKVRWDDIAGDMPGETQRYVPSVVAKWDKYGR